MELFEWYCRCVSVFVDDCKSCDLEFKDWSLLQRQADLIWQRHLSLLIFWLCKLTRKTHMDDLAARNLEIKKFRNLEISPSNLTILRMEVKVTFKILSIQMKQAAQLNLKRIYWECFIYWKVISLWFPTHNLCWFSQPAPKFKDAYK